jgi:predicted nucleotide-binding protein
MTRSSWSSRAGSAKVVELRSATPDDDEDEGWQEAANERPTDNRATEVGLVVSHLARADSITLRKVRKILEDHVSA